MTIIVNGVSVLVKRVFRFSNVALLDNGQYLPLDLFGIDALASEED